MKTVLNSILLAGVMTAGSLMAAAPAEDDYFNQFFERKYGRTTPAEDARIRAEQASSAFRQGPTQPAETPNWIEQHLRGKQGRYSKAEEARLATEGAAFRADPASVGPAKTWFDEWYNKKYGRYPSDQ